jgi:ABC-2 type transport system ATP-binding protein
MVEDFVIKTTGLRKTFISKMKGGKKEVEAVRGVDLTVKKGEIFGFLGPNGAGKSTTQRMLSTLLPPTGGEARILGFDLARQQEQIRQNIGYVGQTGGTDPAATGLENLILQAQLYGLDIHTARKYAGEFVERFQMGSFIERQASTYSGGQKRRLDIALGMIHHPKLLLLDEPTSGLDPQSRAYLWDEIEKLKAEGVTIFLSTHYMEEADRLCDNIAIIDNGKIIVTGTPSDLKSANGADSITLGFRDAEIAKRAETLLTEKIQTEKIQTNNDFIHLSIKDGERVMPDLLRLLDSNNLDVQSVTLSRSSLDNVFLNYTGRSIREDDDR